MGRMIHISEWTPSNFPESKCHITNCEVESSTCGRYSLGNLVHIISMAGDWARRFQRHDIHFRPGNKHASQKKRVTELANSKAFDLGDTVQYCLQEEAAISAQDLDQIHTLGSQGSLFAISSSVEVTAGAGTAMLGPTRRALQSSVGRA